MNLAPLTRFADDWSDGAEQILATSMQMDSRLCVSGSLFVCTPGLRTDAHDYLEAARQNGAVAAIVTSPEGANRAQALGLAWLLFPEATFQDTIWRACDVFLNHPTRSLKLIGVTGTNGKTTTAWLVRDMLAALGLRAGYLGTLGFQLPGEERELSNTTPFAVELYNLIAEARDKGVEAMAMEVSSHALAEKRADGLEFDVATFTNLTQDHLDFHGSMEAYEAAKWRLFSELPKQTEKHWRAAINVDDPVGQRWAEQLPQAVTYGLGHGVVQGIAREVSVDRIVMDLQTDRLECGFAAPLGGSYNVSNLLAATASVLALHPDVRLPDLKDAWSKVRPVPGRFEAVPNDAGIGILVDYAHTPDALEKLLDAVRPLAKGRVITVFGCGGDRDRTKRPKMARSASERSDLTVVTSDNPRTEDPGAILRDIEPGIVPGRPFVSIVDRPEAIVHAVQEAKSGDVVVIAGKGHENYQIIGRTKYPMDDRELARRALGERASSPQE
jgi:UDP-N-acetylmuramyl-tripeptide synthetase